MKDFKSDIVYLVSDYEMDFKDLCNKVEEGLKNGVGILQYRAKEKNTRELCEEGRILKEICDRYNATFIINDRVDVALVVDADGVHVGQKDMKVKDVRRLLGATKIIGASVKNKEEAIIADREGADYIGVGALFKTETKLDADYVSLKDLIEIRKTTQLPLYGIGGIKENNLTENIIKNLDGVAVVSVILQSNNIERTVKNLEQYFL